MTTTEKTPAADAGKRGTRGRRGTAARARALVRGPDGTPGMLVARTLTSGLGYGAYLAGCAVFFTGYVGLSAERVGLGMSLEGAVGLLVKVPLGVLADRMGARRSWAAGAAFQALLLASYPLIRGTVSFFAVMALSAVAASLTTNGRNKYLGDAIPAESRVRIAAYLKTVENVGMAAGTGMSGVVLATDSRIGYLLLVYCNAAAYVAETVLLVAFGTTTVHDGHGQPKGIASGRRTALRDYPFVALSVVNGVLALYDPLLLIVLPLWILERTDAPRTMIAVTLVLNMVLTISLQVAASRGAKDAHGGSRAQLRAGRMLCASSLVLAFSASSGGLLTSLLLAVAVAFLTLGEVHTSAGAWSISYAFAPVERRGEYLAVYDLGKDFAWIVGPAALTWLLTTTGPVGWAVVAGLFFSSGLMAAPATRWVQRSRARTRCVAIPDEKATVGEA